RQWTHSYATTPPRLGRHPGRTAGVRSCRVREKMRSAAGLLPLPFTTLGDLLAHGLEVHVWCPRCHQMRPVQIPPDRLGRPNQTFGDCPIVTQGSSSLRWRPLSLQLRCTRLSFFSASCGAVRPKRTDHRSLLQSLPAALGNARPAPRSTALVGLHFGRRRALLLP